MFRKTSRSDEDFNAEIRSHIEIETDRLVDEEGLDRELAALTARRAFGNITRSQERFYESTRHVWLDNIVRDVRYALRLIAKAPGSSVTILLSLAFGIGVNAAIFSLADQALLRTLPVPEPETLVQLDWNGRFVGSGMGSVGFGSLIPYPLYRELGDDNDVFADLFARAPAEVHVTAGDRLEPVVAELVSGSYFRTLRVRPALGRLLGDDDDRHPGAHPVIVLSHDFWQSRFGADPGVIGRRLRMNGSPMTVIGVAQRGFHGVDWSMAPAIWVPMMMKAHATPGWSGLEESHTRFAHVYGRLERGVSRDRAETALTAWFSGYLEEDTRREGWPHITEQQLDEYLASKLRVLPGGRGQSALRQRIEQPLWVLAAATGLILLLACLNVANLSMARALTRRRATALRAALGASRARILVESLTESALLAGGGCLVGLLCAPVVSRVLLAFLPQLGSATVALRPDIDGRVLVFALCAAGLTTLVAGVAPALYAVSIQPTSAFKQSSPSVSSAMGIRRTLVVGQFALALVLLMGAGLFARTLGSLRQQGPGFSTTNLTMFRVAPSADGYGAEESRSLFRDILAELEASPDVAEAGVAAWEMLSGGGWNNPVTVHAHRRFGTDESLAMNAVSPDFFRTLGATVTRGRAFDSRDVSEGWALRSAIVNEEFVRRFLPEVDPLGARLGIGARPDTETSTEIIGVVESFHDYGLRDEAPQIFFSFWERPADEATFYVRTKTTVASSVESIRSAIQSAGAGVTILSLRSVDDQLDRLLLNERMLATLASAFGGAATLLAMVGLYGVLSFSAARRAKEIAIRLALGASRWAGETLLLREAFSLTLLGLVAAVPLLWLSSGLVESLLFGVHPMDVGTLVSSALLLAAIGVIASGLAARRTGRAAITETLRID